MLKCYSIILIDSIVSEVRLINWQWALFAWLTAWPSQIDKVGFNRFLKDKTISI